MGLLEYVIDFEKHSAIKSQVLVDFVAEWMEPSSVIEGEVPETPWVVYCDSLGGNGGWSMSYPVFMPKPSTHCPHDPGLIIQHIRPKVLTDNQMS
jgi:hypothetical protein